MYSKTVTVYAFLNLLQFSLQADGDKAKQKCEEYAKLVYAVEDSPVMTPDGKKDTNSKCGIVEVPLIIGGTEALEREFPHMASIGFAEGSGIVWQCGGTIISDTYILTAAHCSAHRDNGEAKRVRVGAPKLDSKESYVQEVNIESFTNHPEYSTKEKYNDIALIKLEKPLKLNEHARPACLNTDPTITWPKAIATGFGKTVYEKDDISNHLMKVQLSNIDDDTCKKTYASNKALSSGVKDSQFCAGEMAGKKDTCQGDSGGPLQIVLKEPFCMYSVIGVTSMGKFCGFENSPGLYTKVASYLNWIEPIVWA